MTKQQVRVEMKRRLGEYFDGYLLVGRVAGTSEIIISAECPDPSARQALIIGATGVVNDMTVPQRTQDGPV